MFKFAHAFPKSMVCSFPVNNIPCYQRAEHELKGPKTSVSNSCWTRDSVSSISRVPLVFWTRVLPVVLCVKTRVDSQNISEKVSTLSQTRTLDLSHRRHELFH